VPFFDSSGLRLQYFEQGQGAPVLLIHGWGGRARRQWHKIIVELQHSYHFFALNLRGHGRSEEVEDPDYDWAALIEDCETLRRAAGVDRWVVVGYSFGGLLALEYAATRPEHVSVVCAVSPLIVPRWAAFAMRHFRWPIAWLLKLARRLPPALSGAMAHNVSKTRLRTLFHTVAMMRAWRPDSMRIPDTVPVVLVLGDEDRLAKSDRVIAVSRKGDVRLLEQTGHFPLWKQRERFVRELSDILKTYVQTPARRPVEAESAPRTGSCGP
jgi:pimeloyl-ACP methyl ester carboxylesterase